MSKRKISVIEGKIPVKGQYLVPVEKSAIEKILPNLDPLTLLNMELMSDRTDVIQNEEAKQPKLNRSNFNNNHKQQNNVNELDPFKRRYNPEKCSFNTSCAPSKIEVDKLILPVEKEVSITENEKKYCSYCGSSNLAAEQPLISDISKLETWGSNNKDEKTTMNSLYNEVSYKCLNCFRIC